MLQHPFKKKRKNKEMKSKPLVLWYDIRVTTLRGFKAVRKTDKTVYTLLFDYLFLFYFIDLKSVGYHKS